MIKKILDVCCGGRMCWIDKMHPSALYVDIRRAPKGHIPIRPYHEIEPDEIVDFRNMPFSDKSFKLILFDPPHTRYRMGAKQASIFAKKYGSLNKETWEEDLHRGFNECWRCLADDGVLIFKWSTCEIPLNKVLKLAPTKPLFGTVTGKTGTTRWVTFMKLGEP